MNVCANGVIYERLHIALRVKNYATTATMEHIQVIVGGAMKKVRDEVLEKIL